MGLALKAASAMLRISQMVMELTKRVIFFHANITSRMIKEISQIGENTMFLEHVRSFTPFGLESLCTTHATKALGNKAEQIQMVGSGDHAHRGNPRYAGVLVVQPNHCAVAGLRVVWHA